ncbi:hypothetical protein, partial [Bradyrhizobium japonicum]|uniref:hypothetical protein n=3 Tax=Bradyrhizobium TaxID=374 RepID=UPI0012BCDDCA
MTSSNGRSVHLYRLIVARTMGLCAVTLFGINTAYSHRAGPGCLDSAPLDLSGFLPGYAERGALRFCR